MSSEEDKLNNQAIALRDQALAKLADRLDEIDLIARDESNSPLVKMIAFFTAGEIRFSRSQIKPTDEPETDAEA